MGVKYTFGDGLLEAEVVDIFEDGNRLVRFTHDPNKTIYSILDEIGQMPLPPYITEKLEDKERYQTVYSQRGRECRRPRQPGCTLPPS